MIRLCEVSHFPVTEQNLQGFGLTDKNTLAIHFRKKHEEKSWPIFELPACWLDIYLSGKAADFTPPLYMQITPFRKSVWEIMLIIPFGKTMTCGEITKRIAKPKGLLKISVQAASGAVSHNSIYLIIPCHRVAGADGSLTGYAGGIEKSTVTYIGKS